VVGALVSPVDRPFSKGGQLMCHEDASPDANFVEDSIGSTWASDAPAKFL
jgi:hypothetical protein